MKKLLVFVLMLTLISIVVAQTVYLVNEDFEGGSSDWTIVNGESVNKWHLGTAPANNATNSMYVSNDDGETNAYTITSPNTIHFYQAVEFPAGAVDLKLTFDILVWGESGYDFLTIFLYPEDEVPTYNNWASTWSSMPANHTQYRIGEQYSVRDSEVWSTVTIPLSIANYALQTRLLTFTWRNDDMVGAVPPAAIDNIVLSYETPSPYPLAVNLQSPANGSMHLASNPPTLTWTNNAEGETPTYYKVYLDTNPDPVTLVTSDSTVATNFTPVALNADSTYYWKVIPYNAAGVSVSPPQIRSFTTYPATPMAVTLNAPANEADNVSLTPTFRWTASSLGEPATLYTLEVSETIDFTSLAYEEASLSATTFTIDAEDALETETLYYWRVISENSAGLSTADAVIWSFTTRPTGMVQVDAGTASIDAPIYPNYRNSYSQSIYYATELGIGSLQSITEIAFQFSGGSALTNSKVWEVFMGTTSSTTFTGQTAGDLISMDDLVSVFDGTVFVENRPMWVSVPLDRPFLYDGSENLVIAVWEKNWSTSWDSSGRFIGSNSGNRSLIHYVDGTQINPITETFATSNWTRSGIPNLRLYHTEPLTEPTITVTPTEKDFGQLYVAMEASQTFTVRNIGAGILTISSIDFDAPTADFTIIADTLDIYGSLATGEAYTFTVIYNPTSEDDHTAVVNIASNATANPVVSITLEGCAFDARVMSFPYIVDFEGSNALPLGWQGFFGGAGADVNINSGNGVNNSNALRLYNTWVSTEVIARTPYIDSLHTRRVSFWARNTGYWAPYDLQVGYMTDPLDSNSFVEIETVNVTGTYTEFLVPLTAATSNYLAFRHTASDPTTLDDIVVSTIPIGSDFICETTILRFPDFSAGESASASLTISNRDSATMPLLITNWELPIGMTTEVNPDTISIVAGASVTIDFTLTSNTAGAYIDTLKIYTNAANMPLFELTVAATVLSTDIIQIGDGNDTTTLGTFGPVPAPFHFRKSFSQTIYPASAFPYGGEITFISYHIAIDNNSPNMATQGDWVIWMKHTSETDFPSTTDNTSWIDDSFPNGDWTKVYDYRGLEGRINFTGSGERWINIPLSTPFEYNGTDNLVIAVMKQYTPNNAVWQDRWAQTPTTHYASKIYANDYTPDLDEATVISNNGEPMQVFPNIRIAISAPDATDNPIFRITPADSVLTFGTVGIGESATVTFTVQNGGGSSFQVQNVTLVGDATDFMIINQTGFDTDLYGATTAAFAIRFTPTIVDSQSIVVRVAISEEIIGTDEADFYEIRLWGRAIDQRISLPIETNFGTAISVAPPLLNGQAWTQMRGVLAENSVVTPQTADWSNANVNGWDIYNWGFTAGHDYGASASASLSSNLNSWIVTPAINTADHILGEYIVLSFDIAMSGLYSGTWTAAGADKRFAVVVSTDDNWSESNAVAIWDNDAASENRVLNDIPAASTGGESITLNLTRFAGQTFKVGFYGGSSVAYAGEVRVYIDNLKIEYTETFTGEKDNTILPVTNTLNSNYPNPFNPSTTIEFGIGNSEFGMKQAVIIDIYNVKGQKVRSLVNGEFNAGIHKVVWNGTDDTGRTVGSGVYFYRMQTDGFSETKKMILMK